MPLEQLAIRPGRSFETSARQADHNLAQHRDMIFRLGITFDALNTEPGEIVAQSRQRTLVQEAGEIIRAIRHQFSAPDADEQLEEFAIDLRDIYLGRGLTERRMRDAKRRMVAAQFGYSGQQVGVGNALKQHRQQRIFLGARGIDFVDCAGVRSGIKIGAQ